MKAAAINIPARPAFPGPALMVQGASSAFPYGLAVVMKHLLSAFEDKNTFLAEPRPLFQVPRRGAHYYINSLMYYRHGSRFEPLYTRLQMKGAVRKLREIITQNQCRFILGTFPFSFSLEASLEAAIQENVPYAAYLHDTVYESLHHIDPRHARRLQDKVFSRAKIIFVINEGMKRLYSKKYGVAAEVLAHTFPEPVPAGAAPRPIAAKPRLFWAGNVYGINDKAFLRCYEGRNAFPYEFCTSVQNKMHFKRLGMDERRIPLAGHLERSDYLRFLQQQDVLIAGLNRLDESAYHEDELSTIFPTRLVEYLASGRPVIVHCPKSYYLAEFIERHQCGLVVSERSRGSIAEAVERLAKNPGLVQELTQNALEALTQFSLSKVSADFLKRITPLFGAPDTPL